MPQRPFVLDPLFRPLTSINGVGPRHGKLFERLAGGPKLLDLLFHTPIDIIDRRFSPKLKDAPAGKVITVKVTVQKHFPAERRGRPYRVWCTDDTGSLNLIFFHPHVDWLKKQLPEGQKVVISGKVELYQGNPQITHPDAIGTPSEFDEIAVVEPVYPLTQGLSNKIVRKAVNGALADLPTLPEWLNKGWKDKNDWPDWDAAVQTAHFAQDGNREKAAARLAYDELLSHQLTLALTRYKQQKRTGRALTGDGALRTRLRATLPFALTGAQERALEEINADMAAPYRMLRLLQGDVGAGKTVVAALSMLNAVECGGQAALLAPTEILARQHAKSLSPWLEAGGVRMVVLTGRDKGKARATILEQIASGAAQIVIGTHAIFQDAIEFNDLALAVVDEQHRFGVHQRLQLSEKGRAVDILAMTATPIPRTLCLAAYGDMDVSRLDEKPPGRKPIDTRLISTAKLDTMIESLKKPIAEGARIYWVCPLVEESEVMDLAAAEERYDVLKQFFGDRVGLVHGRMKGEEKDEVMGRFARGELDILVATTVIEVGVDVPEATIMVIEHAERFGLAQLHQLRGRVGRGGDQSYCFLLYAGSLGETAKERLTTMRETEDGFVIAEKDLELRGAGDVLGVRQSGLPKLKLADLENPEHRALLATAQDEARLMLTNIIEKDPTLKTPAGKALRILLYLFERDQAIAFLNVG